MKTSTRYWLFQIPGWILTAGLLFGLHEWVDLPLWAGVAVMVLLVIKDAVLYPFLRPGYETDVKTGIDRLIGERGVVKQPLDPEGLVQVAGELWKARAEGAGRPIPVGTSVAVTAAEGMTLLVAEAEARPQRR